MMNPMTLYMVKRFIFNHKKWLILFAILCGLTEGTILKPVDSGIDTIEKSYPESAEVMEMVRSGTHGINAVTQGAIEVKNKYDELTKK
mgnify:CR=1 FL=1